MKLASLNNGTRDGRLVVVSRDLARAVDAASIAPTLQHALDRWSRCEPDLKALAGALEAGTASHAFAFNPAEALAPLPRTAQFVDSSAFPSHGRIMSQAYILPNVLPPGVPVLIQRQGDDFRGPHDDFQLLNEEEEGDFEGEFGVIVDDVPMGATPAEAQAGIRLVTMLNDMGARKHTVRELSMGFGAINLKPATVFAPVAVTPDELQDHWRDGRVHLDLTVHRNGKLFGRPNGREMGFSFGELLSHLAYNRNLRAGTLLAGGTISNEDVKTVGSACLAEHRALEKLAHGQALTPFLRFGDLLRFEALDAKGRSVFGAIEHRIVPAPARRGA